MRQGRSKFEAAYAAEMKRIGLRAERKRPPGMAVPKKRRR
jgi:hypothetical protein